MITIQLTELEYKNLLIFLSRSKLENNLIEEVKAFNTIMHRLTNPIQPEQKEETK